MVTVTVRGNDPRNDGVGFIGVGSRVRGLGFGFRGAACLAKV